MASRTRSGLGGSTPYDAEKAVIVRDLSPDSSSVHDDVRDGGFTSKKTVEKGKAGERVYETDDTASSELVQIEERNLSWVQVTFLLLTEYVVLAILSFPWSYSKLGMAGGILTTMLVAGSVLYTSHVLWRFCMAHPECRDIADVCYAAFGGSEIAWWAGFTGLALNNLFICGLHLAAGTTAINTMKYHFCSTVWGVILFAIYFLGSLCRNFRFATTAGVIAAGTMFVAIMIVVVGAAVQGTPNGYDPAVPVEWTVWSPKGTTFVAGLNGAINILYSMVGQALIPSYVNDMKRPQDFPKALYLSTAIEMVLWLVTGIVVYYYVGNEYAAAPAYGALIRKYAVPAAAMILPTIIIVAILYSIVTSRAIFFRIFPENSVHRRQHTVKGWTVWAAIVLAGWIFAFIVGEAIPLYVILARTLRVDSEGQLTNIRRFVPSVRIRPMTTCDRQLLRLVSSLFDSQFGYSLWAICWYAMYKNQPHKGAAWWTEAIVNVIMFIIGLFLLGAGTYASVEAIINSYATGSIHRPFACGNSGFTFTR